MEDLAVVKLYSSYVWRNNIADRYFFCTNCPDSELPMQPFMNDLEVGLFCLMPGCKQKVFLGRNTIDRMKRDLKFWKIIPKNA